MTMHNMSMMEPAGKGLVYNGTDIRDKGDMLSLTDMWKAAGSPEAKRPSNWARKEGADFIEHVGAILNMPVGHIETSRGGSGAGRGATFAHWQIGLAYAKYLSPEFHMWCNSVVRSHMEGKPVLHAGLSAEDRNAIGGIVKACTGVVIREQIANLLPTIIEPMLAARLAESALLLRKGKTAKQIWDAAGMPPKIKGATNWFGNRLKEGGCLLEGRADRGDGSIRLFDPDKAETLLSLGLRHKARVYASERMGQGRFKLVEGVGV
jgi:hypothetical protein